jgi:hypothetical protein
VGPARDRKEIAGIQLVTLCKHALDDLKGVFACPGNLLLVLFVTVEKQDQQLAFSSGSGDHMRPSHCEAGARWRIAVMRAR